MYHPYFRGRAFELLALRESADILSQVSFVPIIEPVRQALVRLERALDAIVEADGRAIVVVNPRYGDYRVDGKEISALLAEKYGNNNAISAGVLLLGDHSVADAMKLIDAHDKHPETLIHAGFTEPRLLSLELGERVAGMTNVFVEDRSNMLYRRHFTEGFSVLLRDGFERMKNSAYGVVDSFSDLHITYRSLSMQGYGDFLTVGDYYSEGGGPAYAVAIHLTYIDPDNDDSMYVYHFVSDTNDTPTDPAGKFAQALQKLIGRLDSGASHLYESTAITEFRRLHDVGHFPGLGHVKKLSMRHHIETLAHYHSRTHA